MLIAKCDRCGTVEEDRRVKSFVFCEGMGYKPTNHDPMAQKFEAHTKKIELCDRCYQRVQQFGLTLSDAERNQIVMLACIEMEPDNLWQPLSKTEEEAMIGGTGW